MPLFFLYFCETQIFTTMAIKFFSGIDLSTVTAGSILKVDSNGVIVAAVDGTDYNTASSGSWSDVGSNIYRNSDVRIGTYQSGVAPAARLHVFEYQSTDVKLLLEDGNTGDASMQFKVSAQSYVMGLDNSDSDRFKLSVGTAFGSTGLTMKTTGQLGINGLPNGDLDVISAATPTLFVRTSAASSQDAIVRIQGSRTTSTTSEIAQVRFETVDSDASGTELARISALKDTTSTNVGRLEFYTMPTNGGTLASRMTIKSDGKVGIGTTDPSALLDVSGTIEANGNITAQSSSYVRLRVDQTDSGMIDMGLTSASADGFLNIQNTGSSHVTDDPEFKLLLNSVEKLRVDSNGNLGVGTSTPQQKLHVEGNIYLGPNNINNFVHSGANLGLQADGDVKIVSDVNDTSGVGGSDIVFGYGSSTNTDSNQDFTEAELGTYPRVEIMRIDASTDRVGIKTSTPAHTLDVGGTFHATNAYINEYIYHNGDTNTYIRFTGDRVRVVAGGTTKFDSNDTYLTTTAAASTYATTDHTHTDATQDASGFMSSTDKTKLDGIATGAEVNVQSDWNATTGDAFIQNKPTLGTASASAATDFVAVGGDTMTGTLALDNEDSLSFESGKHWITYNDGEGNFNIRIGHKSDSSTNEVSTETGYAFHDEWSQSSGWREFNVSGTSITAGGDVGTWRRQMYYDYNDVRLSYQGGLKFQTTNTGITVTGEIVTTGGNSTNWNTAYGWGDHASAGYSTATGVEDNADVTPSWVPDSDPSYLTAHPSISEAADVDNSNGTVIQDLTFDGNGHVTATGSVDLDGRYYTETESDARFLRLGGGTYTSTGDVHFRLKGTGTGTSDYSEFSIDNNANDRLVIGSIGSNYSNDDWAGSRYIYSTAGELRIKAATNLRLFSGGTAYPENVAVTFDSSQNATFEGDITVSGTLSATAKSFDIEHPTKEGKRLVYGSLEGAEHGVYFRGKGTGEVIELPDHWTGLVHEDSITVQLTPIGKNCVWVEDIKDNSVHVGMDNDTPYFYFIQAERKDIDKLIVEQDA